MCQQAPAFCSTMNFATSASYPNDKRGSVWGAEETALVLYTAYNNPDKSLQTISHLCHEIDPSFVRPGDAVRKKIKRLMLGGAWSSLTPTRRMQLIGETIDRLSLQEMVGKIKPRNAQSHQTSERSDVEFVPTLVNFPSNNIPNNMSSCNIFPMEQGIEYSTDKQVASLAHNTHASQNQVLNVYDGTMDLDHDVLEILYGL